MATSALRDIERIKQFEKFLLATTKTADYNLSSEKQIDLFRQSIEEGARAQSGHIGFDEKSMTIWANLGSTSATAVELFPTTPFFRPENLLENWKNEGEPGYILGRIEDSLEIIHGKRIAHRIRVLRQIVREDDGDDISPDSLRSFYEFLILHPEVSYPEITLTPDGNIYVCWNNFDRALFSIHFLPELRVRYVVFVPDRKRPNLMDMMSGTSSVDTVLEIVDRAYGVTRWVRE